MKTNISDLAAGGAAFGTSGVRGTVEALTDEVSFAYSAAFLQEVVARTEAPGGRIAIGYDLRPTILSDFTQGGSIPGFTVYEWVGSGGDQGSLQTLITGVDCQTSPPGDTVCGRARGAAAAGPRTLSALTWCASPPRGVGRGNVPEFLTVILFVAGYFALPSLLKKGAAEFLRDKVVRLLVPWALCVFVVIPLVYYDLPDQPVRPFSSYWLWYLGSFETRLSTTSGPEQQSVYWFISLLFAFFAKPLPWNRVWRTISTA